MTQVQAGIRDPIAAATKTEAEADAAALKTLEGLPADDWAEDEQDATPPVKDKPDVAGEPIDEPKEPADEAPKAQPKAEALPDDLDALADAFGLKKDRIAKRIALLGEDEVRDALRQEYADYGENKPAPKPDEDEPAPKKPDQAPMHDPELDTALGKLADKAWQQEVLDYLPGAQPLLDAVKNLVAMNRALSKQVKELSGSVGGVASEMFHEKASALSSLYEANIQFYGDPTDPNPSADHMTRRQRLNQMVGVIRAKGSGRARSFSELVGLADRYVRGQGSAPAKGSDAAKKAAVQRLRGDVTPRGGGGGGTGKGFDMAAHEQEGINILKRAGWR